MIENNLIETVCKECKQSNVFFMDYCINCLNLKSKMREKKSSNESQLLVGQEVTVEIPRFGNLIQALEKALEKGFWVGGDNTKS